MTQRAPIAIAAWAIVALAAVARAEPAAPAPTCTVTLEGAQRGTFACVASVGWNASTSRGVVAIVVPRPAPFDAIDVALERAGEPAAGSWTSDDAVGAAIVRARGEPHRAWSAAAGPDAKERGRVALTLERVAPRAATPEGKGYEAHGELRATLVADRATRAAGTVTMRVRF